MNKKEHVDFDNLQVAFASKNTRSLKKTHLIFSTMKSNALVKAGTTVTKLALKSRLPVNGIIRRTLFDIFCGGETIEECLKTAARMQKFKVGAILDYSVEGEKTEEGFEATTREILRTIERAGKSENIPFGAFKITGIGAFDLLAKIHAGQVLNESDKAAYQRVKERVEKICAKAHELGVPVLIDAEETWIQKPIDDLTIAMMARFNKEKAIVYYTFQMYCHRMLANLKALHGHAKAQGYILGAKLVRGAYMEKERLRAKEHGYEDPIQPDKASSDRDYDAGLTYCVENIEEVSLFAGSHNEDSNYYLTQLIDQHGLDKHNPGVYFAQLYGMSDNISYNLADKGFNVAKYVPYGPIRASMPYLFRRAEENTSVKGQSGRELMLIKKELARRRS